ncbi:MAG TPA: ferritin-like domain-containing protein [Polyangiaceae bacterium]
MTPDAFLSELDAQNLRALARIRERAATSPAKAAEPLTVVRLLMLGLKNELEATECAAAWIVTTPELQAKLAFARQVGDEARHYRLIENRLRELGAELPDPTKLPRSPLLDYLLGLKHTVERVAAGQFTREALAVVRNEEFIRFCETHGDHATAALYTDVIQPDETHHHQLGRSILRALATTDELQHLARDASARTLSMADELLEIARLKGIASAPGC